MLMLKDERKFTQIIHTDRRTGRYKDGRIVKLTLIHIYARRYRNVVYVRL